MKTKNHFKTLSIFISLSTFAILAFQIPIYSQTQTLFHDPSFNSNNSTTNGSTYAIEVINSGSHKGKILVGGFFNFYNGINIPGKLVRLKSDGAIDHTFTAPALSSTWGTLGGGGINTIAVQPWDGKYLVGGVFTVTAGSITYRNIIRLLTDGSIDPTFNPTGGGTTAGQAGDGKITKILTLDDEKQIVVGGVFGSYKGTSIAGGRGGLIIIDDDGTLFKDANVTSGAWTGEGVYDMAMAPDGKIVLGGEFGLVGGFKARRVARILRDGTFDVTWINRGYDGVGPGDISNGSNGTVRAVAVQPDGRIIIGGDFTGYIDYDMLTNTIIGNRPRTKIARINTNGRLDNTFNYNSVTNTYLSRGFDNRVNDIMIDVSGNIYAVGAFSLYDNNATSAGRLAKLLPDGTRDPNFSAGLFNTEVQSIAFQNWENNGSYKSEAHIIAAGNFADYNGVANQPNIMRFYISASSPSFTTLSNYISGFSILKVTDTRLNLIWKVLQPSVIYSVERSKNGVDFEKVASYSSTNANVILSHEDNVYNNSKVYYRISVSLAASTNAKEFSKTLVYISNSGLFTNITLKQNEIKLFISSEKEINKRFNLRVITMSGQLLYSKEIDINNRVLDQTLKTAQPIKNCLVILSNEKKEVLQKMMLK